MLEKLWQEMQAGASSHTVNSMFDFKPEFQILQSFKDTVEELQMLTHVVDQQQQEIRLPHIEPRRASQI